MVRGRLDAEASALTARSPGFPQPSAPKFSLQFRPKFPV